MILQAFHLASLLFGPCVKPSLPKVMTNDIWCASHGAVFELCCSCSISHHLWLRACETGGSNSPSDWKQTLFMSPRTRGRVSRHAIPSQDSSLCPGRMLMSPSLLWGHGGKEKGSPNLLSHPSFFQGEDWLQHGWLLRSASPFWGPWECELETFKFTFIH